MNKSKESVVAMLVIDPVAKTIEQKHRSRKAIAIAKNDHNSILIGFEIPRYIGGYDVSSEDIVKQIHYVNMSADEENISKGFSDAESVAVEDDTVCFRWYVPNTATLYAGVLSFGVTFEKYENVDDEVVEKFSWSTFPYGTAIGDSFDNDAETVEREYKHLVNTCNAIVMEALKSSIIQKGQGGNSIVQAGGSNQATDEFAVALGQDNKSVAKQTFTTGYGNEASGVASSAGGSQTRAKGVASSTNGILTEAEGKASNAKGYKTKAIGNYSDAKGIESTASGVGASAKGGKCKATGDYSNAEGNETKSDGIASHSEGSGTKATASFSHTEGQGTVVKERAIAGHAEGKGVVVGGKFQHVQGTYNIVDDNDDYADVVGNGEDDTHRSNAYTLDWEGNARFAGDVYVRGTQKNDDNLKKLATEKYVDDEMKKNKEEILSNSVGALKGEVSGVTAVAIKDVSEVNHNISVELSSDNIPLFPYEAESIGGIPYTTKDDGTIVMSGYCSNGYDFPLSDTTSIKRIVLPSGTYTFECELSGNDVNNGVYGVFLESTKDYSAYGGTFTIDIETEFNVMVGTIVVGGEWYNITLKPMLSKGDKLSQPLPDNPQVKIIGGNLFDTTRSIANSTCPKLDDGSYRCNVKNGVYSEFNTRQMNDILQALDGQKVTFSMSTEMPTGRYMLLIVYYTNGNIVQSKATGGANSTSITLNHKGRTIDKIGLRPMQYREPFTDTTTIFKDLQVELGERSPYVRHLANLDVVAGDNITSIHSAMTFISKTNGLNIKVKYNKDANIVIASQQAQIDELKAMILNLTTN